MPRLYRDLRSRLVAEGIEESYLAEKLDVHPNTVSRAMTGKRPWTLTEVYKILDILHEPAERLTVLFPPGGIAS